MFIQLMPLRCGYIENYEMMAVERDFIINELLTIGFKGVNGRKIGYYKTYLMCEKV